MKNFMPYKDVTIDLSKVTLASILGECETSGRSNGAGKSSLFDAISYSLYGKGRVTSDYGFIRLGEDNMEVELIFNIADREVRIVRGRKVNSGYAKLYVDNVLIASGIRSASLEIEKLLNMTADVFFATCFFGQGKLDLFTDATPAKRKDFLSDIMQLNFWRDCWQETKDRKTKFSNELEILKEKILMYEEDFIDIDDLTSAIEGNELLLLTKKKLIESNRKKLRKIKDEHQRLNFAREEYKSLKTLVSDEEVKSIYVNIDHIKGNLADKKEKNKKYIKTLKEKIKEISEEFSEELLDKYHIDIRSITEEISRNNNSLDKTKKKIRGLENLGQNGECPTCHQRLGSHFTKVISDLKKKIKVTDKNNASMKKEKGNLHETYCVLVEIRRIYKLISENKSDIGMSNERLKDALGRLEMEENKLKTNRKKFSKNLLIIEENLYSSDLENMEKKIKNIESMLMSDRSDVEKIQYTMGDFKGRIKSAQKIQSKIATYEKEISELIKSIKLYNILIKLFSKQGGIPAFIIENAVSVIEEEANSILREFGSAQVVYLNSVRETKDGRKVDTLDVIIGTSQGDKDYSLLSGGERTQVSIALRLALSSLLSSRHGVSIDSVFIDEALGSLDKYNRGVMMGILKILSKRFKQIFLISHHNDIRDSLPDTILVKRRNGISKAVVLTN